MPKIFTAERAEIKNLKFSQRSLRSHMTTLELTETQIWDALKEVNDPEIPISLVDMGMIYGVKIEERNVQILLGLTATACPAIEFIFTDIRERLAQDGLKRDEIAIKLVWDPPWTKSRISEEGRIALQHWGISV